MLIRNDSVTVGTTQAPITTQVKAGDRRLIVFTNRSTLGQIITLSAGEEAQLGKGITLAPNDSWVESIDNNFIPYEGRYYAISDVAGAVLAIHERSKV